MARIFITGSADGLGFLAARRLLALGHEVLLHVRNAARAQELRNKLTAPIQLVTGDLSDMEQTIELANAVNKAGSFDVIIHNAGVYQVNQQTILHVNTIAPYILTCLIQPPQRLIYLCSNMHLQGRLHSAQFEAATNQLTYSDSKFHMVLLAKAIARKWPAVFSNAVDPGWVPTKMGGSGAPDNLDKGYETQVWLATSMEPNACVSGKYFYHRVERKAHPLTEATDLQEQLLQLCEKYSGVKFPG
ncbi:SDR family NAD(P)-dependent oxidoreductase [Flavihumibacter sp. RY-1]|uniref:SDR family NAD(P)-dependent oxidoreductase n=1 Tax=Flavihumibacter fluminis TaxID=2909236 RepID=A0ABS9BEI5_9BACT|nr:SDR family NAD(P)-dependent oxidoreductase [Flavihumibacter fluminis]MCF1714133.1 SDR family NAD(P)-dependent oxidoreductase [Flavihumibacter fluminis]